ncbi:hypothetical protein E6H20_09535 [Candidatus Bathyarchaeota archaeon]|nr:MAG: hypothetical protein E6H20_09535 [Candidatus Bathyarchaeota archaeon]
MLSIWYGFKIQNGHLRLPLKPGQYAHVKLNGHKLQALSGLDVRSVTLTSDSLSISYSKEATEIAPEGYVGIDRNLNNVTNASIDKMCDDTICQKSPIPSLHIVM